MVEQRAKSEAELCQILGNTRVQPHWFGCKLVICFNKDCYHSTQPCLCRIHFITKLHTNASDEDSPETNSGLFEHLVHM